jgi:hypothetical protein
MNAAHCTAREQRAEAPRSWGPCVAPSSSLGLGDVGEDCLSPAETFFVSAGRVPQPPRSSRQHRVTRTARDTGAAFSLVTFSWPNKRKSPASGRNPDDVYLLSNVIEGVSIASMAAPAPSQRAMPSRHRLIDSSCACGCSTRNEELQAPPVAPFDFDIGSPSEHRASATTSRL